MIWCIQSGGVHVCGQVVIWCIQSGDVCVCGQVVIWCVWSGGVRVCGQEVIWCMHSLRAVLCLLMPSNRPSCQVCGVWCGRSRLLIVKSYTRVCGVSAPHGNPSADVFTAIVTSIKRTTPK